jgi:putative hydrolase of the HAD superfamily
VTPLHALILDYGNVLTLPQAPDVIETMAARLGVTVDAFNAAYWEHRHGYDAGEYPAAEYWRRVLGSLGRRPESDEEALLDWLIERDADSWMRYREDVWDIARDARAGHIQTALLTNMSAELADRIRRDRALDRWFDVVVVSAEVRCVKPDPRIYRLCLERLDVEPAQALFVDDRPDNVAAAAALGMRTVHFTGEDTVTALRSKLGQPR